MSDVRTSCSRRHLLTAGIPLAALGVAVSLPAQAAETSPVFRYSLNTSTIREQKVGIVREVEIAAAAGYDAIEPWMGTLDEYVNGGGSLPDLKKRIEDAGITVESAIGFARWIVNDDAERAQGLEQAKRDMDRLAQIGGKRIAAPPVGATDKPGPDLPTAAQRYRALLEVGAQTGVIPQLEVWGFSKTLSRLEETAYVAIASGHPLACLLLDAYHLHKGGSPLEGLKLVAGTAQHVFHLNDYPAEPSREQINDSHRVYPGDGVAPLPELLTTLRDTGFHGYLSLELFNRDYWKQDPLLVAKTGVQKMKAVVARLEESGK
jgi:2-keto-myo-inositol isomerase